MFREMRRKRQALAAEDCVRVLQRSTSGVLAVCGEDAWPYAVPLSYVYANGKLYFHCAKVGQKLDAVVHNDKVSFCVIDADQIVPEKYTTYFRSVIVFGHTRILKDAAEKRHAFEIFAAKYSPDDEVGRLQEIDRLFEQATVVEVTIDHMTGKEAIELVRAKEQAQ